MSAVLADAVRAAEILRTAFEIGEDVGRAVEGALREKRPELVPPELPESRAEAVKDATEAHIAQRFRRRSTPPAGTPGVG